MEILLHIHSILRWAILLLCLLVLVKSYIGFSQQKIFGADINKLSVWLLICTHLMLVIGLFQYFAGPNGAHLFQMNGAAVVMKTKAMRFYAVEHIAANLLGVLFITAGRSRSKKALSDTSKHKALFWFTLIGLMLFLSRIPWPGMAEIGRGWF